VKRLLVVALLLHHIEGVCKPWSAAALAARRVLAGFVEHVAGRDRAEATRRASDAQTVAVERARRGAENRDDVQKQVGEHRELPRRAERPALGRGFRMSNREQRVRQRRAEGRP
jgi:hypothetical protein